MQKVLRKRILRDLKENLFRYLALSALIIFVMYLVVNGKAGKKGCQAGETVLSGLWNGRPQYTSCIPKS